MPVWALGGRIYRNEALRIHSFEVPREWAAVPQVSYPGVLLLAKNAQGARLLLAQQWVVPGTTALTLAAAARTLLLQQGFADPKILPESEERVRVEAARPGGKLLQSYIVDGDAAFVMTLFTSVDHQTSALKAFDEAVRSLKIGLTTGKQEN